VFPIDADNAIGLTCSTFKPDNRNAVLHYGRCGSGAYSGCVAAAYPYDGYTYFSTDGCESDTACYVYGGFDPNAVHPAYATCMSNPPYQNTLMECGVHISYMDGLGYVGDNYSVNFYDEGLAHMALYLRSGAQLALDAFRKLEGQDGTGNNGWLFYPENAQGDAGGHPRDQSILGAWAAYILDGKTSNLSGLRNFANRTTGLVTNFANNGACNQDLREGVGYPLHWLAAAALWDPNASTYGWATSLGNWYTTFGPCALHSSSGIVQDSWANGFISSSPGNSQTPALTATNGSPVLTGTGIQNNQICGTTPSATGTATVTRGSDVATSSAAFVTGGGKIMFEDSVACPSGLCSFNYIFDSSSQVHLSGMYPGTSGNKPFWISTDPQTDGSGYDSALTFGTGNSDTQLTKQWNCTWNNSGQITLDRNWDGQSGTVYGSRGALAGVGVIGYGTQPFFLGVNTLGHRLASLQSGSTGTNFNTLGFRTATWIKNYGFDPVSGGSFYGRIYPSAETIYADSSQPTNFPEGYRNPQIAYNGSGVSPNFAKQIARVNSGEMQNAAGISYANDSTTKSFWDTFYANIWDLPGYTQTGFGSDGLGSENCGPNNNFALGKWTGFCFGIGMSHQWPAARLGGVTPVVPRTLSVGFNLALAPGAVEVIITVTSPAGVVSNTTCTSSPCAVTADARQGAHILRWKYLDGNSKVLAQSEPLTVLVQ
jgi:hypothetical protein